MLKTVIPVCVSMCICAYACGVVFVCVCLCVYLCVSVSVCMFVCVCLCVHHTCVYLCMHACVCAPVYVSVSVCMCVPVCAHTCVSVCPQIAFSFISIPGPQPKEWSHSHAIWVFLPLWRHLSYSDTPSCVSKVVLNPVSLTRQSIINRAHRSSHLATVVFSSEVFSTFAWF